MGRLRSDTPTFLFLIALIPIICQTQVNAVSNADTTSTDSSQFLGEIDWCNPEYNPYKPTFCLDVCKGAIGNCFTSKCVKVEEALQLASHEDSPKPCTHICDSYFNECMDECKSLQPRLVLALENDHGDVYNTVRHAVTAFQDECSRHIEEDFRAKKVRALSPDEAHRRLVKQKEERRSRQRYSELEQHFNGDFKTCVTRMKSYRDLSSVGF